MSALTRPRGPLPRRVYWFRRALVLLVLLVVVLGAVRLIGGGDDDPAAATSGGGSAATVARRAADEPPTSALPSATPSTTAEQGGGDSPAASPSAEPTTAEPSPKPTKRPLPQPDGPCDPADVLVAPRVEGSRSDGSVEIRLAITTVEAAACTFEVDPESVFVTVSSKERTLWASQHCGSVVPTEDVVARRTKAAEVVLRWDGRESAVGCPAESPWVDSGEYTIAAMARGSVNVSKSTFTVSG